MVALLALFVAVGALPQYFGGWPWATPLKLPAASRTALQAIPDQGLELPGWRNDDQSKIKISGHNWSVQQISSAAATSGSTLTPAFLLLRPQTYGPDQPEVEWLDIEGSQRWDTDSHQKLTFSVPAMPSVKNSAQNATETKTVRISGDFFRAWSKEQTYAVLQWYAWPTGGSASPARWFWADQKTQWNSRQRMPWVAISLWLPISPLGDISPHENMALSLGKTIQKSLLESVFVGDREEVSPEKPG